MSQVLSEAARPRTQVNEFNYRPVPVLAPVSLVLGLCAAMALLTAFGVVIALIGTLLATVTWLRIRRAGGDLGGGAISAVGLGLSSIFLVAGIGVHSYAYATEVPEGYIRVNFPEDISRKQFVFENGRQRLHPDVVPLVEQNIFIKGYMRPAKKLTGLTAFELLKDNGKCCFGGDPAPWDSILVTFPPGESVDLLSGLVSVGGRFHADMNPQYGAHVYSIEATHFEQARSEF